MTGLRSLAPPAPGESAPTPPAPGATPADTGAPELCLEPTPSTKEPSSPVGRAPGPSAHRSIGELFADLLHAVLARVPDGIVIGLLIATFVILGVALLMFVILEFGMAPGTP